MEIGFFLNYMLNEMISLSNKIDLFEEYIKNLPPTRKELGYAWSTAIGLQDVDGIKPSEYPYETARKNIDGKIDPTGGCR